MHICRNIWFSLASVATISACIFLFCMFFGIMTNVQHVVKNVESTVGVTIFFDEGMSEDEMKAIGKKIADIDYINQLLLLFLNYARYKRGDAYEIITSLSNN